VAAALVVVAVFAVAGAAVSTDSPSGEQVLNRTVERYETADSVVGTAVVTVENGSETATATVEFAAAGNQSRVVVTRDGTTHRAGRNESVTWYVTPNRTGAWEHDALRQRLETVHDERFDAGPGAVANRTTDIADAVDVERLRTEPRDGTEAHVLRVTPENGSIDGRATLWVATDDGRLLRMTATDGTNRTVVDIRETRFDVTVHDSTFDPPGDRLAVTSVDRYETFAAVQSATDRDLPRTDAEFREAGVIERASGTTVAQLYRTDGDNVTVVSTTANREFDRSDGESVRVGGHDATATTVRDAAVVYWRDDGVTTAVVVDADRDRAVALARGVN